MNFNGVWLYCDFVRQLIFVCSSFLFSLHIYIWANEWIRIWGVMNAAYDSQLDFMREMHALPFTDGKYVSHKRKLRRCNFFVSFIPSTFHKLVQCAIDISNAARIYVKHSISNQVFSRALLCSEQLVRHRSNGCEPYAKKNATSEKVFFRFGVLPNQIQWKKNLFLKLLRR